MEAGKYSEQDIQDYAAGSFSGDVQAIRDYINSDHFLVEQVKAYQEMYGLLKTPMPSLSFNLAEAVAEKVQQRKFRKSPVPYSLIPYFITVLSVAGFLICWDYFDISLRLSALIDSGILLISSVLMIAFIAGFYFVEVKQMQKKFMT